MLKNQFNYVMLKKWCNKVLLLMQRCYIISTSNSKSTFKRWTFTVKYVYYVIKYIKKIMDLIQSNRKQ